MHRLYLIDIERFRNLGSERSSGRFIVWFLEVHNEFPTFLITTLIKELSDVVSHPHDPTRHFILVDPEFDEWRFLGSTVFGPGKKDIDVDWICQAKRDGGRSKVSDESTLKTEKVGFH